MRVGSTNQTTGGSSINIQRFYQHPKYNRRTIDYDVSIVQLALTLNYNDQIQPIALPNANTTFADDTICLVSGWGIEIKFLCLKNYP